MLHSLLAAPVLWLAGLGLLALLGRKRPRTAVERHAVAVLSGLSLGTIAPVLGAALLGPHGVPAAAGLLLALACVGVGAELRRPLAAASPAERWSLAQRAVTALLVALALQAVVLSFGSPVHTFDSTFHFAYKGALLRHDGLSGAAWTELDGDVGRVQTHPGYPPGVGALQAVSNVLAPEYDPSRARPLWALFVLAPAGLLYAALRSRGRWPALLAAGSWLALPLLVYNTFAFGRWPEEGWLLDGGADLPLAAFCFGALVHARRLASPALAADVADALLGGLCLGAAVLSKNEGLALALVLVLSALVAGIAARASRTRSFGLALVAAIALVVAYPWLVGRSAIPAIDEDYPTSIAALLSTGAGLERWRQVAAGLLRCFVPIWDGPAWEVPLLRWGLLWVVALAALGWRLARPRALLGHPALAALLFVAGGTAVYAFVLLATPWDLAQLFGTLIPDRLVLHLAPAGCLLAASLLFEEPAGA